MAIRYHLGKYIVAGGVVQGERGDRSYSWQEVVIYAFLFAVLIVGSYFAWR